MNAIYHTFFTIFQRHKLYMGLTNIVDTNTNDSALLKQNFHPPRALFRLLDTLSQIIIAIKFAIKLKAKQRCFFHPFSQFLGLVFIRKLNVMLYCPVQNYNEPFYFMSFRYGQSHRAVTTAIY